MKNTIHVFLREYLERVRSKTFIILTVLMPLIFAALFAVPVLIMAKSSKTQRLAIVDLDGRVAPILETRFKEKPEEEVINPSEEVEKARSGRGGGSNAFIADQYRLNIVPVAAGDESAARARLSEQIKKNELDAYLWIGKDSVDTGAVDYYARNLADMTGTANMQRYVSNAVTQVRLVNKGVPADQIQQLLKRVELRTVRVTEAGEKEDKGVAGFILPFFFTMLLYMTLLLYGIAVMRSVIEEKTSRVFEVLLSSVRPIELMAGKILGVAAVGLTQYTVWAVMFLASGGALGAMAIKADLGDISVSPLLMVFFVTYFVLGYMLYSAMFAALGAAVNSEQEAQQLQMVVVWMLIVPIMLMNLVMRNPSSPVVVACSLFPFFTPILMFLRITVQQPPAWQLALSIVLMVATTAGVMWICARIYRVGILMYGKRPTLPELIRWIRMA
jgi:ABC-2 type transport system permease protein